ncbi:MAG: POTRA domain-containing protein, partial [Candidatus Methylumidiphilus sp.]
MNWKPYMATIATFQPKLLLSASLAVLLGWGQPSQAVESVLPFDPNNLPDERLRPTDPSLFPLDPMSDPSKPSNRPLSLPAPESDETAKAKSKSLKLPGEPLGRPEKPGDKTPKLALKQVLFEGNEAVPTAELDEVANPYLNRRLNGNEVEDLRYKLTLYYVNKGYINSGAVIPGQTVKDGVLRIKVIEGRLSDVRMTGQERLKEEYIRDRLLDDSGKPLNTHDLQQRYLMLLNDPLIGRINGTLMPGLHPGDAILDLKVVRSRPYGGYLGVDNYAPPSIGGYAGRMGA